MNKENKLFTRILMAVLGVIIIGFAVGAIQMSALGVDPFTAFVSGIGYFFGMDFGKMYPIINGLIIIIILFLDRKLIGFGTITNMLLIGISADLSREYLLNLLADTSMGLRFVIFAIALVIMGMGISFYLNADLGAGAYDAIQLIMTKKNPNLEYKYARIICDVVSVIVGFIGKANLGIGTLINAFLMGPIVSFFDKNLTSKFYDRTKH